MLDADYFHWHWHWPVKTAIVGGSHQCGFCWYLRKVSASRVEKLLQREPQ